MYDIRFQLHRNGNISTKKGNQNGIGADQRAVVGSSWRSPQRIQSELDQAKTDTALDKASHLMMKSECAVRFYSIDDSAVARL
jgi:hypothetical protein